MSKIDAVLVGIFLIGFILFLLGANIYNGYVGYTGVYMFIGAIVAYVLIYIYKELTKHPEPLAAPQNP